MAEKGLEWRRRIGRLSARKVVKDRDEGFCYLFGELGFALTLTRSLS